MLKCVAVFCRDTITLPIFGWVWLRNSSQDYNQLLPRGSKGINIDKATTTRSTRNPIFLINPLTALHYTPTRHRFNSRTLLLIAHPHYIYCFTASF